MDRLDALARRVSSAELDLAWMTFLHCFFDEIARGAGKPGMPDFMRPEDVAATKASFTGQYLAPLLKSSDQKQRA